MPGILIEAQVLGSHSLYSIFHESPAGYIWFDLLYTLGQENKADPSLQTKVKHAYVTVHA